MSRSKKKREGAQASDAEMQRRLRAVSLENSRLQSLSSTKLSAAMMLQSGRGGEGSQWADFPLINAARAFFDLLKSTKNEFLVLYTFHSLVIEEALTLLSAQPDYNASEDVWAAYCAEQESMSRAKRIDFDEQPTQEISFGESVVRVGGKAKSPERTGAVQRRTTDKSSAKALASQVESGRHGQKGRKRG